MNIKDKNSLLVQRYLEQELTKDEEKQFKILIKRDKQLKNELIFQQNVDDAIISDDLELFKKDIERIHQANFGSRYKNNVFGLGKVQWVAALIVLLIACSSILIFNRYQHKSTKQIYERYFAPYEPASINRSGASQADSFNQHKLNQVLYHYNRGDYKGVMMIVDSMQKGLFKGSEMALIAGVCCMEQNDFIKARNYLNLISKSYGSIYTDDANWFMALCYLKEQNLVGAKEYLNKNNNANSYYSQKVESILIELNQ